MYTFSVKDIAPECPTIFLIVVSCTPGDLDERIEFVKNKGEEVKAIEKRLEQHRRRDNHENGIGGLNNGERLVS